jgi:hypothetical protein
MKPSEVVQSRKEASDGYFPPGNHELECDILVFSAAVDDLNRCFHGDTAVVVPPS